MKAPRKTLALIAFCLFGLTLTQANAQTSSACRKIERKASTIMRAAHPTVKLLSTQCTECCRTTTGYRVCYRFRFRKAFSTKRSYTDLTFRLDRQGRITHVSGKTPGFWQPFDVADLGLLWLKSKAKALPLIRSSTALKLAVDYADAAKLLQLYLRYSN